MTQTTLSLGIIGAGKFGITLSQLATAAGYQVYIAGSGDPEKIRLTVDVLSPGAVVVHSAEVATVADIAILAVPLSRFRELPAAELAGKIVIDAMNYWWEVDGPRSDILPDNQSSSEAVQTLLSASRVVKALSHLSYHDLYDGSRQDSRVARKAVAIAGNDAAAVRRVQEIVERLGFAVLPIGVLSNGSCLEPGSPAFGASVSLEQLKLLVGEPSSQE